MSELKWDFSSVRSQRSLIETRGGHGERRAVEIFHCVFEELEWFPYIDRKDIGSHSGFVKTGFKTLESWTTEQKNIGNRIGWNYPDESFCEGLENNKWLIAPICYDGRLMLHLILGRLNIDDGKFQFDNTNIVRKVRDELHSFFLQTVDSTCVKPEVIKDNEYCDIEVSLMTLANSIVHDFAKRKEKNKTGIDSFIVDPEINQLLKEKLQEQDARSDSILSKEARMIQGELFKC